MANRGGGSSASLSQRYRPRLQRRSRPQRDPRWTVPTRERNSWLYRRRFGQIGRRLLDTIQNMQAVTIAQVHGAAVGGGVLLMAACDLRVVATGTVMFISEVDLGTHYSWGAVPLLLRELGPAITRELIMTCRRFTAEEGLAWRWINRVSAPDGLADEVMQLAQELSRNLRCPSPLPRTILTRSCA
jgi:enoyl-CoA hydratase/carnithine racemase